MLIYLTFCIFIAVMSHFIILKEIDRLVRLQGEESNYSKISCFIIFLAFAVPMVVVLGTDYRKTFCEGFADAHCARKK